MIKVRSVVKKVTAAALAAAVTVALSGMAQATANAEEESAQTALAQQTEDEIYTAAGFVRSVYTNEWITAQQALTRPIAVMMPTDKSAQPSYGISSAKILYEIMEEGEISRQMAIIDDWTGL